MQKKNIIEYIPSAEAEQAMGLTKTVAKGLSPAQKWAMISKSPASAAISTNMYKGAAPVAKAAAAKTAAVQAIAPKAAVAKIVAPKAASTLSGKLATLKGAALANPALAIGAAHALSAGAIAKKALEKPEMKLKKLATKGERAKEKLGKKVAKLQSSSKADKEKKINILKIKAKGKEQLRSNKEKFLKHFVDKNESLIIAKQSLREYIINMFNESVLQERRSLPAKLTATGAIVGNVPGAAIGYGVGRAFERPEDKLARKEMKLANLKSKIDIKKQLSAVR